jgi:hypothetical protein
LRAKSSFFDYHPPPPHNNDDDDRSCTGMEMNDQDLSYFLPVLQAALDTARPPDQKDAGRRLEEKRMNGRMDQMEARLAELTARLENAEARLVNSVALDNNHPLVPIRNAEGVAAPNFPRTFVALVRMDEPAMRLFLQHYGLPTVGEENVLRQRVKKFIGMPF